ncbi:MAG: chemotaxis protein CheB [Rhodobacter sp.]|nr:chemotaxis protein CheB [Rhodobacter sp.]MCA3520702.1 chemotaxis protein CheB [Rhodobacter sp.]MCA3522293.1 chemotaxis protein CheB [Rhodobacter sp.]MCA3527039.1 chemotaxis protein CheB [Rhodobacter sp.]MCA3527814.1 chemotaxis protein CheB [Rhodobacter sp.]
MPSVKLLVATSSAVTRGRLIKALSDHPGLNVIGSAADLSETYTLAEAMEPDVVLVAQEYTTVPEWDCMRSLFYALDARWVGILPAPPAAAAGPARSEVPMVHSGMTGPQLFAAIEQARSVGRTAAGLGPAVPAPDLRLRRDRLVLIGASTGGVDALLSVLAAFPQDCPPTAVVQHTGRNFSDSLIRLLDRRCKATVLPAHSGLILRQGTICVAAGSEGHLRLSHGDAIRCTVSAGPPVSGHMPSVDELFRSAVPVANRVVAALLTGMGRDGAAGLLELRSGGATTLAQDEDSSVVYGMPGAAWDMGAVQQRLPLHKIGAEILRACAQVSEGSSVAR